MPKRLVVILVLNVLLVAVSCASPSYGGVTAVPTEIPRLWQDWGLTGRLAYRWEGKINVYDFDTGEHRVYLSTRGAENPSWHPEGRLVAYSAQGYIHILDTWRDTSRQIGNGGVAPDWHPDGQRIIYAGGVNNTLYIYDVESATETPIVIPGEMLVGFPIWHPTENVVVFQGLDMASPIPNDQRLYQLNLDAQPYAISLVTRDAPPAETSQGFRPVWSTDGEYLLFDTAGTTIYRIDWPGGNMVPVSPTSMFSATDPALVNQRFLVFNGESRTQLTVEVRMLWVMPLDNSREPVRLFPGMQPDWIGVGRPPDT